MQAARVRGRVRLVAPLFWEVQRGGECSWPPLGRALSSRRRYVQFDVVKRCALERAFVAPIPVN
jgi:hypothetical protein